MSIRRNTLAFLLGFIPLLASIAYAGWSVASMRGLAWTGMQFTQGVAPENEPAGFLDVIPGFRAGAVTQIYSGSPAAEAGIRSGDKIREANRIPTYDLHRMREVSRRLRIGEPIRFRVERGGRTSVIVVHAASPLASMGFVFSLVSSLVVALVFGLIGLIVYGKKSHDHRSLLFYLISMLVASVFLSAVGLTSTMLAGVGINDPGALAPATRVFLAVFSVIASLLWPMLLHFALVFPNERPILIRYPGVLKWIYGLPVTQLTSLTLIFLAGGFAKLLPAGRNFDLILLPLLLLLAAVGVRRIVRESRTRGWTAGILGRPFTGLLVLTAIVLASRSVGSLASRALPLSDDGRVLLSLAAPMLLILGLVLAVLVVYPLSACIALYRSYREAGTEEKAQVRWPLWGTIVALAGLTLTAILGVFLPFLRGGPGYTSAVWLETLSKGFYLLIPISFSFAILKYRLMDIELILRKTLVYSVLTAMVLVTYLLLAGGLGGLLVKFANVESVWVAIAATVVVAAALVPVRNQVQHFVDRRFFRDRFDYSETLQAISVDLRRATDEREAADVVAQRIQQAVRSRAVVLFAPARGALRPMAKVGLPDEALERLSLDPGIVANAAEPVLEVGALQLTDRQRRVLRRARATLLIPMARGAESMGVLSVGAKLSEEPFDERDRRFLAAVADHAAVTLENLRLRRRGVDVDKALEIQRHLLPKELPVVEGYDIAAHWTPSRTVGGDYYDVLRLDDNRIGVCIADAAGKGMSAALMMSNVQAAVRALAPAADSPAALCRQLNDILADSVAAARYISFFFADVDISTGALSYSNAGHNPPMLLSADGSVLRLTAGGPVLGAFPDRSYKQQTVKISPGGRLLMFTDGVTEAQNAAGEEFGDERLLDVLRAQRGSSAAAIERAVVDAVDAFSPGELTDDATLVVLTAG